VVIGGGPIGLLVGLVAGAEGADVTLSEVSSFRRGLAAELGLDVIDPIATDPHAAILERTGGAGADVVFEVSGSAAGADVMTSLASIRGRLVVVAIFPEPQPVQLFDFFWKELRMVGARVYEPEDYERAIDLLAAGALPLERLISAVEPLDRLPSVLEELDGAAAMKVLIDCRT
jgi:threonine dehydrogenase-like Zn-dependent dehydrogenase